MPYDGKILSRAMARFDEDNQRRARQFRERQQQLFAREPELADIDRRLRGTMSQIITRALKGGRDPVPAIHAIRDENLALQRRRGEILTALGCPADYLEEKPRCARCGDAGFLPDGSMCACLRSYYAREQIAELSDPFLSQGNQYGEGWFLTGEMAELLLTGVPNIVCIQPFACLPNHVVGKGVIKQLGRSIRRRISARWTLTPARVR